MRATVETEVGTFEVPIPTDETFVQFCANRVAYGHWMDERRTVFIPPGSIRMITLMPNV